MRSMASGIKSKGYIWQDVLGEGAFSTVLLCKRIQDDGIFAAKVMNFDENRRLKWEAENEIEIMKNLRWHPYIVSLHDVLREAVTTTLILEYVSKTTFFPGIAEWANYTEADAQATTKQLLSAVSYCHRHRVIHRDISPLNIMWVQRPTLDHPEVSPWLKLIDFNLARRLRDGKTEIECDPVGTDLFMSPEALQDKPVIGLPSDVWSLGVILFFCLVGYPPFWADNYKHFLKNIEEGNYLLPKKQWSPVSVEAQHLVKEMLTLKASRRLTVEDALKHQWLTKRFHDDKKASSELSIVQARLTVYLDRTRPAIRGAKRQMKKISHPKSTARKAYVPDKDLETQALQIKENNNTQL